MTSTAADDRAFAGFWQRRIVAPVVAQLRQGITPEKIALTIAVGTALGLFPVFGTTTALCAVAGVWLRLNQPLIQAVNYLLSPLHLLLLLPFYRAGEVLFRQPHVPIFSVTDLVERFRAAPGQFFIDYGMLGVYGVVVWALIAPALIGLIYFGSRPLLRRLGRMRSQGASS